MLNKKTKFSRQLALLLLSVLLLSHTALAAEDPKYPYPQLIQNAFQSFVVYPTDRGSFQLITLPTYANSATGSFTSIPGTVTYGITDSLQFSVTWGLYNINSPNIGPTTSGMSDGDFTLQYSWMYINNSTYSISVAFDLFVPTGNVNQGLSTGFREYAPTLIIAKDLPEFLNGQIFTQITFGFVERVNTPTNPAAILPAANEIFWNLVWVTPYKKWRFLAEINWQNNQWNNHGTVNQLFFTPGLIWHPDEYFEAGIGVPIGLAKESDRYRVILELTYSFDSIFKK